MIAFAIALGALALLAAFVVVRRAMLLRHESPQMHHAPFEGRVFRVGHAAVAERRCDEPKTTVVCMHGFVEDMRYFARLYEDASIQLVAIASCGYHVPVKDLALEDAAWASEPRAPFGSIAYDAEVLVQALEHLPRAPKLRVHGHSRGGAVVLEAARVRPELFAEVEVVLEAPVLPRGKLYAEISAMVLWLYPFAVPGWRKDPLGGRVARAFGALDDPYKREFLEGVPHNPKRISTFIANVRDLLDWMASRDASLYENVRRGAIVVPKRDRVLDARAMRESAANAKHLEIVDVDCSHFVTLDRPESIPPL